jgi:hypothetical protein
MDALENDPRFAAFLAAKVHQEIEAAHKAKEDALQKANNPHSEILRELQRLTRAAIKTHLVDIDTEKGK